MDLPQGVRRGIAQSCVFVPMGNLKFGDALQIRQQIDQGLIDEYTEVIESQGAEALPPVTAFTEDNGVFYVADGYHRIRAHRAAGKEGVMCQVHQGGLREALLHAVGANASHGLRRTSTDKRAAVAVMLEDVEWSQWSDRRIAKTCNVSDKLVATVRRDSNPETAQTAVSAAIEPAEVEMPAAYTVPPPRSRRPTTITIPPAAEADKTIRLTIYAGDESVRLENKYGVVGIAPDWIRLREQNDEEKDPWE